MQVHDSNRRVLLGRALGIDAAGWLPPRALIGPPDAPQEPDPTLAGRSGGNKPLRGWSSARPPRLHPPLIASRAPDGESAARDRPSSRLTCGFVASAAIARQRRHYGPGGWGLESLPARSISPGRDVLDACLTRQSSVLVGSDRLYWMITPGVHR